MLIWGSDLFAKRIAETINSWGSQELQLRNGPVESPSLSTDLGALTSVTSRGFGRAPGSASDKCARVADRGCVRDEVKQQERLQSLDAGASAAFPTLISAKFRFQFAVPVPAGC